VAAFAAAVRFRIAHSIDIVDPAGIGRCVAFSAIDPALLCNTSVETMSILDDDPDDFLAYLYSIGVPASRDAFVPRFYVSNYLVSRHSSFATLAQSAGISHRLVQAMARRITKVPTGGYHVLLDDDTRLEASDVLVCTGNGESYVPDVVRAHVRAPRLFECLYPEERVLKQLAPRSRVPGTRWSPLLRRGDCQPCGLRRRGCARYPSTPMHLRVLIFDRLPCRGGYCV
jgi:uncharacterized NAD(P)/FAD-binding protein YdhS